MKQRLQLAVAVLHEPSILILDEPTSGVDPIARDAFWRTLIDLSRDDGVTIFVTTHFMNEADRCDRISLMHAGKVLAVGAPQELVKERGSASLEDCFVGYLAEAAGIDMSKKAEAPAPAAAEVEATERPKRFKHWPAVGLRAARDGRALARSDPPGLRARSARSSSCSPSATASRSTSRTWQTATFDQDDTPESRELLQGFDGSRYFSVQPPITSADEAERRLQKRQHADRRRSAARIRPRPSQQAHAGSRRDGRRRHDVPRRDGQELRDGRDQEAGRGIAAEPASRGERQRLDATTISRPAFATIRPFSASTRWCPAFSC